MKLLEYVKIVVINIQYTEKNEIIIVYFINIYTIIIIIIWQQ